MQELDPRKQHILRAVVRDYVETAEPVGSEALAERYQFGVKSATLRNEMAEMSELGYLQQKHTSAGRIPSDKGYRFYVDRLLTPRQVTPIESRQVRDQIEKSRQEVERVLHQTCRILSALTHYVSMATAPEMDENLVRQVHLAVLDRHRLLVVIAFATGRIEHVVVSSNADLMSVDLGRIEHLVSAVVGGLTLAQAIEAAGTAPERLSPESGAVYCAVMGAVRDSLTRIQTEESAEVYVEGTAAVLRQPEFALSEATRSLIDLLEERRELFSLLREVYAEEARVVIGSESRDPRMQRCSLVAARYTVMGRYVGIIGVLGPTRMDYDRTLPAVRFMARSLGEVLTKLSL